MMISRDEICDVFGYLIQTIHMTNADLNRKIEIMGETVVVGNILQHAEKFYEKLVQEKEKVGGGGMHIMTQDAYVALMQKIEEADRIASDLKKVESGVGEV